MFLLVRADGLAQEYVENAHVDMYVHQTVAMDRVKVCSP